MEKQKPCSKPPTSHPTSKISWDPLGEVGSWLGTPPSVSSYAAWDLRPVLEMSHAPETRLINISHGGVIVNYMLHIMGMLWNYSNYMLIKSYHMFFSPPRLFEPQLVTPPVLGGGGWGGVGYHLVLRRGGRGVGAGRRRCDPQRQGGVQGGLLRRRERRHS